MKRAWSAFVTWLEWLLWSRHRYLSTSCRHGDHGYCQSDTGSNGAKTPAVCKFCDARCVCRCHRNR